jgi:hypothetical protein
MAATAGNSARRPRTASCATHVPSAKAPTSPGLHDAANRLQPLTSPINQASPRPSGGQPSMARASRMPPPRGRATTGIPGVNGSHRSSAPTGCLSPGSLDQSAELPAPAVAEPGSRGISPDDRRGRNAVRASASASASGGNVQPRGLAASGSGGATGSASAGGASSWPGFRRALAWYSGPCLRGSAYSLGLIVQYVPLVWPYHEAPDHSGSNGSWSTPSYEVDPGVARRLASARRCLRSPAVSSAAPAPGAPGAPPAPAPPRVPVPRFPRAPAGRGPASPARRSPAPPGPVDVEPARRGPLARHPSLAVLARSASACHEDAPGSPRPGVPPGPGIGPGACPVKRS